MAEKSYWWTTSGAGSGDQVASYTQGDLATVSRILAACGAFQGVAPNFQNVLVGSVTGPNTVQISSGGAVVDGHVYYNDAGVNVNIPSTGSTLRIDRIVLRADWSAFTVRIHRIAGTESASPTAPAITQGTGTTWDIALYRAQVNTSGTVTLTDERMMASPFKFTNGSHETNFTFQGDTRYVLPGVHIVTGRQIVTIDAANSDGSVTVPFNMSFVNSPHIFLGSGNTGNGTGVKKPVLWVSSVTSSQFTLKAEYPDGAALGVTATFEFSWMALGVPAAGTGVL